MNAQPEDRTGEATPAEEVEDLEASDADAEEVSGGMTNAWPKSLEIGSLKADGTSVK